MHTHGHRIEKLVARAKVKDIQQLCFYPTLPAVHLKAPRTRDPRRDPKKKTLDEHIILRERDHKRQISSGPLEFTTLMVMS